MIDPSVPQSRLKYLTKRDHLLMHGVSGGRLSALSPRYFEPVDSIFIDLAGCDLRKHHAAKERDQVIVGARMLSSRVSRASLSLSHDVKFAQVQLCSLAKRLPAH
jgi:hypothetical protein